MERNSALAGKRVLIVRPADASDELERELTRAGARVIHVPVIAIAPPDDPSRAQTAVEHATGCAWIVFTSANGVRAFFDRLEARTAHAQTLQAVKIAAIGSATARALRSKGVSPDLVPERFVAEELAQALIASTRAGDRVLLFRAQDARDVLPRGLREAGRMVDDVAAYKTLLLTVPALSERVRKCDVVAFTSASTVRGVLQNVSPESLDGKVIACIGPITADHARRSGLRVDVVARNADPAALCDALVRHFAPT